MVTFSMPLEEEALICEVEEECEEMPMEHKYL